MAPGQEGLTYIAWRSAFRLGGRGYQVRVDTSEYGELRIDHDPDSDLDEAPGRAREGREVARFRRLPVELTRTGVLRSSSSSICSVIAAIRARIWSLRFIQIRRGVQVGIRGHASGWQTQSTSATRPSITSTISSSEMSLGKRASLKPPLAPRTDLTSPALRRPMIRRLMYFSEIPCAAAISLSMRGVAPGFAARS